MISLHSAQRGGSVNLSELIYVVNNPDQFKERIDALNAAAQKRQDALNVATKGHRDAMEASYKAKLEHDAAALEAHKQQDAATAAAADLQRRQTQLNETVSRIDAESKRIEAEKNALEAAKTVHAAAVVAHVVKSKALSDLDVQARAKEQELQARHNAITQIEAEIMRATKRIHELLPK